MSMVSMPLLRTHLKCKNELHFFFHSIQIKIEMFAVNRFYLTHPLYTPAQSPNGYSRRRQCVCESDLRDRERKLEGYERE